MLLSPPVRVARPHLGREQFHVAVRGEFVHSLDKLQYNYVVRNPVERANSAFWHYGDVSRASEPGDEFPEGGERDIDQTLQGAIEQVEWCKTDKCSGDLDSWYTCCFYETQGAMRAQTIKFLHYVSSGFYAEHMRSLLCQLVFTPMAEPCPRWDDPVLEGILNPSLQNRVKIVRFAELSHAATPATVDAVLQWAGLPPVYSGPQGAKANRARADHYSHKHKKAMSSETAVSCRACRRTLLCRVHVEALMTELSRTR